MQVGSYVVILPRHGASTESGFQWV